MVFHGYFHSEYRNSYFAFGSNIERRNVYKKNTGKELFHVMSEYITDLGMFNILSDQMELSIPCSSRCFDEWEKQISGMLKKLEEKWNTDWNVFSPRSLKQLTAEELGNKKSLVTAIMQSMHAGRDPEIICRILEMNGVYD
jgi:hypothetical protein